MYVEKYPAPALTSEGRGAIFGHEQRSRFPACTLHGSRIVNAFPAGCPLREANPLDAVFAYKQRGFGQYGKRNDRAGNALLGVSDTCDDCLRRLLAHPHVRYVRSIGRQND